MGEGDEEVMRRGAKRDRNIESDRNVNEKARGICIRNVHKGEMKRDR